MTFMNILIFKKFDPQSKILNFTLIQNEITRTNTIDANQNFIRNKKYIFEILIYYRNKLY